MGNIYQIYFFCLFVYLEKRVYYKVNTLPCSECGDKFYEATGLKRHMLKHTARVS